MCYQPPQEVDNYTVKSILTFSWLHEFQCNSIFINADLFFLVGNIYKSQFIETRII